MLHDAAVMNDTTDVTQVMVFRTPVKALLSMLPCILFLYVNGVMLFALLSKPLLLESPRYILFGHLLFTESLQLIVSILLYIFAVTMVRMINYVCMIVTQLASIAVKMSPLNLALMSLERYVAICFPLRHADIVTTRKTGVAVAVMWTAASLDSFVNLFLFVSLEKTVFTLPGFCNRQVFQLQIYLTIYKTFTILCFIAVSMIVIYTYIAVLITVKSASSSTVHSSSKAHKTVLLHLIQLCLCLISTLFSMINSNSMWNVNPAMAVHIQYALFLGLIIFPKCLSPLIYGLRDHTFRIVFKYYFTFGFITTSKTFPKSRFQT